MWETVTGLPLRSYGFCPVFFDTHIKRKDASHLDSCFYQAKTWNRFLLTGDIVAIQIRSVLFLPGSPNLWLPCVKLKDMVIINCLFESAAFGDPLDIKWENPKLMGNYTFSVCMTLPTGTNVGLTYKSLLLEIWCFWANAISCPCSCICLLFDFGVFHIAAFVGVLVLQYGLMW